jgi:hypothetical protein
MGDEMGRSYLVATWQLPCGYLIETMNWRALTGFGLRRRPHDQPDGYSGKRRRKKGRNRDRFAPGHMMTIQRYLMCWKQDRQYSR